MARFLFGLAIGFTIGLYRDEILAFCREVCTQEHAQLHTQQAQEATATEGEAPEPPPRRRRRRRRAE